MTTGRGSVVDAHDDPTLVFVYNVDGTPVSMLKDLYSGITTGTTDCHLCDLTFGRLLKDRSWTHFVSDLPLDVDFQLRSTFIARHRGLAGTRFPAAFLVGGTSTPHQVISCTEMDGAADLDQLRALVAGVVDSIDVGAGTVRPDRSGDTV